MEAILGFFLIIGCYFALRAFLRWATKDLPEREDQDCCCHCRCHNQVGRKTSLTDPFRNIFTS